MGGQLYVMTPPYHDCVCACVCVFSVKIDVEDKQEMRKLVNSCIGTKFIKKW